MKPASESGGRRPEELTRREALAALGVGAAGAYGVDGTTWERFVRRQDQAPRFFTAEEMQTVRALMDMIIPRDEKSGSATDSGAHAYADFVVSERDNRYQTAFRDGLAWFDAQARQRFGRRFHESAEADRAAIVELVAWPARAAAEHRTQVDFFNRLRDLTASGFFSSRMGVEDLGYQGGVFNPVWRGAPPEALAELGLSYAEWDAKYGGTGAPGRRGTAAPRPPSTPRPRP